MTVTLFSKKPCVQCDATVRKLDADGVEYSKEDIYEEKNLEIVKQLGYMAAPVVIVRDSEGTIVNHWSGFNPAKIAELAPELKAA